MIATAMLAAWSRASTAQVARDSSVDWLLSANSVGEGYLRSLQLVGVVPQYPWSVRAFSGDEIHALVSRASNHPWDSTFALRTKPARLAFIAPQAEAIYNSGFAYGSNDGPVWAGRGLTAHVMLGGRLEAGPLEVQIAPEFYRAENRAFPIMENGLTGAFAFANAQNPMSIDLPQRFGDRAYGQIDPGQSVVRLSAFGGTIGLSTGNEFWGPAVAEPFLLGNNAAGFRHLFFGTAKPLGLLGLAVHFRGIAGTLDQSDYSTTPMIGRRRYLSGLVGVVTLRQVPGLEVGGGRVFHNFFPDSSVTLRQVVAPIFHGLLKKQRAQALGTNTGEEPDNQLASLFARWAFPAAGFEVYGEFGREDSSFDPRDLVSEPDHDAAVIIGFRKGWQRSGSRLLVLSSEVFNDRESHLQAVREESVPYIHSFVLQGHTERGQVLGAPDLMGGGGLSATLEEYSPGSHAAVQYTRAARIQLLPSRVGPGAIPFDVMHSVSYEKTSLFRKVDFTRGVTLVYDVNRDLTGDDAVNLRFTAGMRAHW